MLERATVEDKNGKYLGSFVAKPNHIESIINQFLAESKLKRDSVRIFYIEEMESDYE